MATKPNSPPYQHNRHLVWAVWVKMLCFLSFLSKCAAVHCDQPSPLWSRMPNGHCSRSLVISSDANLQNKKQTNLALGFFAVSLIIAQSDLGVNLLGRSLLGRLTAVWSIFHLWIIFLSVQWWTPNNLETALWPKLMGRNTYLSKIIADVSSPWCSVYSHLNVPDQQTD